MFTCSAVLTFLLIQFGRLFRDITSRTVNANGYKTRRRLQKSPAKRPSMASGCLKKDAGLVPVSCLKSLIKEVDIIGLGRRISITGMQGWLFWGKRMIPCWVSLRSIQPATLACHCRLTGKLVNRWMIEQKPSVCYRAIFLLYQA